MIPGLELDPEGLCPMCRTAKRYQGCKNVMPVLDRIPPSPGSRYDAAVFYTGGKDSSYLLYYLARIQGLRVLAPVLGDPLYVRLARESIKNARKRLPSVDFW